MTKTEVQLLREKLNKHLASFGEEHNLKVFAGKTTYSDNNMTIKVECSKIADDGTVYSKEREEFIKYATLYGLQPEDLGKRFTSNNETFEITGLKSSYRKYPIIAKGVHNGKSYKFTENSIQKKLARG